MLDVGRLDPRPAEPSDANDKEKAGDARASRRKASLLFLFSALVENMLLVCVASQTSFQNSTNRKNQLTWLSQNSPSLVG